MKARKLEQRGKQEPRPFGPILPPPFLCCLVIRTQKGEEQTGGDPTHLAGQLASRRAKIRPETGRDQSVDNRHEKALRQETQADPGYTPRGEDPTFYRILIDKQSYVYDTVPRSRRGIHLG